MKLQARAGGVWAYMGPRGVPDIEATVELRRAFVDHEALEPAIGTI